MSDRLVHLYRFFRRRKGIFFLLTGMLVTFILIFASRIRLEEDISRITSDHDTLNRYEFIVRNFKFAEKLIILVTQKDSLQEPDPEQLIRYAEAIRDTLLTRFDTTYIRQLFLRADDSLFMRIQDILFEHLPVFLTDEDFRSLDSLITSRNIDQTLQRNYKILVSPASMVLKKRLIHDPLGISNLAIKKLQSLQGGDQYMLWDGCLVTRDQRHLLMFLTPANPPSETKKNSLLIHALDDLANTTREISSGNVGMEYFGSVAVPVGNANQIKQDIMVTLIIALAGIFLLISWYFRSLLIPLIGFIPAFFGGGLALAILYLVNGNISAIALGIGSVILGLIIDYALYMINHYRKKRCVETVIKEMALTIIICSLTSIGAFLCLTFLNSIVLHDLGWFAAISVFGAALFALTILPQFMGKRLLLLTNQKARITMVDRIASIDFGKQTWLVVLLALGGFVSFFYLKDVHFEKDMNSLSYMSESLQRSSYHLDQIADAGLKNVYLVSTGNNLDEALQTNEKVSQQLENLKRLGRISDYKGITSILLSDSIQRDRMWKWKKFWTPERKSRLFQQLQQTGNRLGFSEHAFTGMHILTDRDYESMSKENSLLFSQTLFSDYINPKPEMVMVTSIAQVTEQEKKHVYTACNELHDVVIFDRQNLTSRFVDNVRFDFDLLVKLSMIFVTVLLFISFGRIELGFTTALPMFFSWLITLGFMGITGIRFNIFNIIISSFIFGLGVDYSILMMRGLLNEYKTGVRDMPTYQGSIFLSSATTIIGVGALLFAKHPALHSIAMVSIVGVSSVVLISYVYQSLFVRWFLFNQQRKRTHPVSLRIMLFSIFVAWIPITTNAIILVIYGILVSPLLPFSRTKKQAIFHRLFSTLSRWYIALNFPRYHAVDNEVGETFRKPAVIICNHQSLIENPALLRLYPDIVILTNEWVFRNLVFGPVAKLAGFIPVADRIDDSLNSIKNRIDEGYSILVFPEGHRSKDGHIQRFHRGAFYIAEKLHLDIIPIVIFGSGDFLRKGNFWGKPNRLFMKILPRITPENTRFGVNYSERTRQIRKYYREIYRDYTREHNTPSYQALTLRYNYLFKGPVLEWYLKIKLLLEDNFETYCRFMPENGEILDIGCGYGFITYMLALTSDERMVTGVDYDEEKIIVARNGFLINPRVQFIHADVTNYPVSRHDGFLLGDVLHYLSPPEQEMVLKSCMGNLKPGGVILIREGDSMLEEGHRKTKVTEFFSTRVTCFNKTRDDRKQLFFTSLEIIRNIAEQHGFSMEVIRSKKRTSNRFFLLKNGLNIPGSTTQNAKP